jgi:hypothetical protein
MLISDESKMMPCILVREGGSASTIASDVIVVEKGMVPRRKVSDLGSAFKNGSGSYPSGQLSVES